MSFRKLYYKNADLKNQTIVMRVDFNVPLTPDLKVDDPARIKAALPTIQHILTVEGAKLVLMSHLGRPDGKVVKDMSLAPVAEALRGFLPGTTVKFNTDCQKAEADVAGLQVHEVLLLENLRFYAAEEKNDGAFAKKLASYGTYYVNDAFGTAHRAHASTEGITKYFPGKSACGDLMGLEVRYLDGAVQKPVTPFVGILGGAKIGDKINVVSNLCKKCDKVLIGGGMSYTFLRAQGKEVGLGLLQADKLRFCQQILAEFGSKVVLPVDVRCIEKIDFKKRTCSEPKIFSVDEIPTDMEPVDIGPATVKLYSEILATAKTVVWNGPMGVFEIDALAQGTMSIAKIVADITTKGATTVVGGGDSASAVEKSGVKVSHISTGGGASLEYLEGKVLPGLEALTDA
jgi:phosphoglycerate kinase